MQPSIETYSSLHVLINACNRVDSASNPIYTGCDDISFYENFINFYSLYEKFVTVNIALMNTFINPS